MFDMIKNIGSTELIIILLVLVILFGANTISDMAKKGGETFKEVKKIKKDIIDATKEDPANP